MNLNLPSQRLFRPAASINSSKPSHNFLIPCNQRRTLFWFGKKNQPEAKAVAPKNTLTEEFLRKKPITAPPVRGDLASSSIFGDEMLAGPKPIGPAGAPDALRELPRNTDAMRAALDPRPESRKRWLRKMVIRTVAKRGRMTKKQFLKTQERELLSKSHDFSTSVKKLNPLARQIAGKTVEEAIIQMRFSTKKAAKDVLEHLEYAKNEAIVKRGMGLGGSGKKIQQALRIQTKDGKRVNVESPTTIYVDQAWVGRGLYGSTPDYRARGKVSMMTNPTTSLSVVLKEEATRIRLHQEREEKIKNRKVWVQLPNRPITAQRQHYSW
ncbi:54S ribosomal subunit [Hyphodiscus hymeniophilus]|uniref:54S ribosomal subunit n=1 Tax=Hyphodiscus hymeniophilus TaxID=353542 RepID=A0A9P7AZR7_9HELO|nr:54S ribosomal subunit [Hyphodiscus hymeniophilus]